MTMVRPNIDWSFPLYVVIEAPRTEEQKQNRVYVDDDGTIAAFLEWQRERECFPIRRMMVAPGYYEALSNSADRERVAWWFRQRGF